MQQKLHCVPNSVLIPLSECITRWYIDRRYIKAFSGRKWGCACLAAIGPLDGSRVQIVVTANPRRRVWEVAHRDGEEMIAHACGWSKGKNAHQALPAVEALLAKAGNMPDVAGWYRVNTKMLDPLFRFAAEKVRIPLTDQAGFYAYACREEDAKTRYELMKHGASAEQAGMYYHV